MPPKNPKRRARVVRCWGGFMNGKLHWWSCQQALCELTAYMPMLYRSRAAAERDYDDVRRIEIRELPARRSKA